MWIRILIGTFLFLVLSVGNLAKAQDVKPIDSDVMFTCFKQGNKGDCVSIALIKAAICVYGLHGVFDEKQLNDTLTEVTLKNGKKYIVSQTEFGIADTAMHIKLGKFGVPELMGYATKCFAVMAKVKQGLDNIATFEESINKLLKGASGHKSFYKLGLENKVVMLDRAPNYSKICGAVAWTKKHVLFVCNGYMDRYGKKVPIAKEYYGGFRILP
jgi:hypothetical protein